MKSKMYSNGKNKRSSVDEYEDKNGLRPVKPKSGKSNKRISIYDELDDDSDMDDYSYESDNDFDEDIYDDEDDDDEDDDY